MGSRRGTKSEWLKQVTDGSTGPANPKAVHHACCGRRAGRAEDECVRCARAWDDGMLAVSSHASCITWRQIAPERKRIWLQVRAEVQP